MHTYISVPQPSLPGSEALSSLPFKCYCLVMGRGSADFLKDGVGCSCAVGESVSGALSYSPCKKRSKVLFLRMTVFKLKILKILALLLL